MNHAAENGKVGPRRLGMPRGFGVASDFTSAVGVTAFYDFKSSLMLEVGYRALWVDFEDGTPRTPGYFAYDTVTHGPLAGLVFEF